MTFDVTAKKGLRKRFFVQNVQSSAMQPGAPNLFSSDDSTEIIFTDETSLPADRSTIKIEEPLTSEYLGGLQEQIDLLNMRLKRVVGEITGSTKRRTQSRINKGILIHGFEGTGKSLLLKRIGHANFRKVAQLQKSSLTGGTIVKNQEIIKGIFKEARARQPSLVLMDNIDELFPVTKDTYTETVITELDSLVGTQVLVIAACRSPSDVNSALVEPGRVSARIELPIPDRSAREQILKTLLDNDSDPDGTISREISMRTHGFTGKDLAWLVEAAEDIALDRYDEHDKWVAIAKNGSPEKLLDGTADYLPGAPAEERQGQQTKDAVQIGQSMESGSTTVNGDITTSEMIIQDFEVALTKVRPTALREIIFESPNVKWEDIGGSQDIQQRLDKAILWPLNHPEIMNQYRKRPNKGVLLYGPPGCSKTLTARAVATKYGLNFIAVKGAELISMYVGESERAVREIFRKARAAAPCVIFFDEIDSIASERDSAGTKGLNVLTTLLNEMDGFDSLKGVLVLAATNKPEVLDPAIMRPGRFDSHFYLGPPNAAARREIFSISTKGLPLEEDLDFNHLVLSTEGYSGAEIVQVCDLATDEAMARRIDSEAPRAGIVGILDFEKALAQTKKAITPEMLAGYQAFGNKGSH